MFILSQSSSYKWPVSVDFPVDGGKYEKQTFDAEFKRMSQPQIEETHRAVRSGINGIRAVMGFARQPGQHQIP
jgi:hypothetical protein